MSRYRVTLVQQVWEAATVEVEANSEEDAWEKARSLAHVGKVAWEFVCADGPIEVDETEKVSA